MPTTLNQTTLFGVPASAGIAIGEVFILDRRRAQYPKHHVDAEQAPRELERLKQAMDETATSLRSFLQRAKEQGHTEYTQILDAHLLMLQDPSLNKMSQTFITRDLRCAEWALISAVKEISAAFGALTDQYFQERRSDVDIIGDRILAAMMRRPIELPTQLQKGAIVVAYNLSPVDIFTLKELDVAGIVTEVGGATGHTAILARALQIPAVVGCSHALSVVGHRDHMVVDACTGAVVVHPTATTMTEYQMILHQRSSAQEIFWQDLQTEIHTPATLADGQPIQILANIEMPTEAERAAQMGAVGIGLYRSEFLFINRTSMPTETELVQTYGKILQHAGTQTPARLRLLDVGSDKVGTLFGIAHENNPALGMRACRLLLTHRHLLQMQIRSMLRAIYQHAHAHAQEYTSKPTSSVPSPAKKSGALLLPLIGSMDEFYTMRDLIREEEALLPEAQGQAPVSIGAMVEVPSIIFEIEELAQQCDFFSVGTNDLIQYSYAIDRNSDLLSGLYRPLHRSHLRMLRRIVCAAKDAGIPVGLCGEMAADPSMAPICAGLGFESLSMPPSAIAAVRWTLRRIRSERARELVQACINAPHYRDACSLLHLFLQEHVPTLLEHYTPAQETIYPSS